MTPELMKRIEDCFDATELEDIYLPYKPKEKPAPRRLLKKDWSLWQK